jgi:5-methyltetrahydrofolate--homocysteine methyltransferase
MDDRLTALTDAVIAGRHAEAAELTRTLIDAGVAPKAILDEGLIAGMNVVGERFGAHEIFLPDVLLAAKAMYAGLDLVQPLLEAGGIAARGTIVLGTVRGDLHDIGKNLVGIMLRGAGFEVIDLGHDVPPERMVETARDTGASIIGMSALLTTTMPVMREVVDRLRAAGLDGGIKTVVGGAPVTEEFAKEIGADAYAYDAANAVEVVKQLTGAR